MPQIRRKPRKRRGRKVLVDLTVSDDELERIDYGGAPTEVPNPSVPIKRRRLTAAECLQNDRIAHGEIDPVPGPSTRRPSSLGPADFVGNSVVYDITDLYDQAGVSAPLDQASTATGGPHCQAEDVQIDNATVQERTRNEISLETGVPVFMPNQGVASLHATSTSTEAMNSSKDGYDQNEEIADLTQPDEAPEVVEMMANGRPRRACAPKSFKGLLSSPSFDLVKRRNVDMRLEGARPVPETMANEIRSHACAPSSRNEVGQGPGVGLIQLDADYRAALIERAAIAYRELWENRLTPGFTHSCGWFDDGSARHSLVQIAQYFGANCRMRKNTERGKKGKHIVMNPTKRLLSLSESDVRATADRIIDRVFNNTHGIHQSAKVAAKKQRKANQTEKEKSKGTRIPRKPPQMALVGVEHALNRDVSARKEKRRKGTNQDTKEHRFSEDARNNLRSSTSNIAKQPSTKNATVPQDGTKTGKVSPHEGVGQGQTMETRRSMFQLKRQRKLEGTKIETDNKGFAMLAKMGWHEGKRLGANENGISEPIFAQFRMGRSGLGIKRD